MWFGRWEVHIAKSATVVSVEKGRGWGGLWGQLASRMSSERLLWEPGLEVRAGGSEGREGGVQEGAVRVCSVGEWKSWWWRGGCSQWRLVMPPIHETETRRKDNVQAATLTISFICHPFLWFSGFWCFHTWGLPGPWRTALPGSANS